MPSAGPDGDRIRGLLQRRDAGAGAEVEPQPLPAAHGGTRRLPARPSPARRAPSPWRRCQAGARAAVLAETRSTGAPAAVQRVGDGVQCAFLAQRHLAGDVEEPPSRHRLEVLPAGPGKDAPSRRRADRDSRGGRCARRPWSRSARAPAPPRPPARARASPGWAMAHAVGEAEQPGSDDDATVGRRARRRS